MTTPLLVPPTMFRRHFLQAAAAASIMSVPRSGWSEPPRSLPALSPGEAVSVDTPSRGTLRGLPIIWTDTLALLLCPDGRLEQLEPAEYANPRAAGTFVPATIAEVRNALMVEFGSGYEVRATPGFVVAQPKGAGSRWPDTMESLHRGFKREFTVRGIPLGQSRFPLVAVVCDSQQDFMRQLVQSGFTPSANTLGVYSALNNRMMLFDHGGSDGGVASTIRHEAAHQSAFNLGLHIRLADNPRWFVEGLGSVFESTMMSSNASLSLGKESIWREAYMRLFSDGSQLASDLSGLIERSQLFQDQSDRAYAASWSVVAYFLERMPNAFSEMCRSITALQPLVSYPIARRRADFQRAVGVELGILANNVHRWVMGV